MMFLSPYKVYTFLILLFIRATTSVCSASATSPPPSASNRFPFHSKTVARKFPQQSTSRTPNGFPQLMPARKQTLVSSLRKTLEVAAGKTRKLEIPKLKLDLPKLDLKSFSSTGFYYGITPDSLLSTKSKATPKKKQVNVGDTVVETLEELRSMRREMEALRQEMQAMKRQMMGGEGDGLLQKPSDLEEDSEDRASLSIIARHARQRHFEKIGAEVERWAEDLLFEEDGEEDGWSEVHPRSIFNRDGRTKAYLKWMKDSRRKQADPNDDREYPCLKMFSTIDAPLEVVCLYLSQKERMEEYNDLLLRQGDLEEITPHSKISWAETYQVLFLKPRICTSFVSHRWLRDGTQVVVNQACEHPDTPGKGELPQGYALRSANFISRDPDDPEKTCIAMVSHGHPGHDVPRWACKTAVNTMVPIQPFNFFYKVNQNVQRYRSELERRLDEMAMVPTPPGEPTRQPAGLAQLGYACFWPQGGGQQEIDDRLQRNQRHQQPSRSNEFHDTVHDDRMLEKGMDSRTFDASENANPPADRERTPIDTAVPSQ
jgi:hypothetical protein